MKAYFSTWPKQVRAPEPDHENRSKPYVPLSIVTIPLYKNKKKEFLTCCQAIREPAPSQAKL